MQTGELFHGFRVDSYTDIPEISARMWRMTYEKNGAGLIWLERPDDNGNKTFGIAFKTVPDDDTGVFHILEHSVLCGSEKYPVKEPFVELIKTSVNTFLNAMTYPDKTVYPVSSRNSRDFLNLAGVYLDAVFYPLSVKNPLAFLQEGWHWEVGEGDDPEKVTCNGVVYSEMKGAYASPDRRLGQLLNTLLFPDNCYGKSSGGDPDHIPELTYERYLEGHRRFYSASNSRIFLDGIFDDEAIFELIDSYLSRFDRIDVDADIPFQKPVCPPEAVGRYAVGEDEDPTGKVLWSQGYVFSDYSQKEKNFAASLLADLINDSNEAPLRRAVLDAGLADDISLYISDGVLQTKAVINVKNTDEDKIPLIKETIDRVIGDIIEKGVDKDRLEAIFNSTEFAIRERNTGGSPAGLEYGLTTLDSWLYGGDPAAPLFYEDMLASLRKKIFDGSGYYEALLREIFFDCPHKASCRLLPSTTLTAETAAAEAERCEAAKKSWTPVERKKIEDDLAELRRFQRTPDSPGQIATIPRLRLSDITERPAPSRQTVSSIDGRPLLLHPQDTRGIVYTTLFFDIRDLDDGEIYLASLIDRLLLELPTSSHSAIGLQDLVKRDLGDFGTSVSAYTRADDRSTGIWFTAAASSLESKADRIAGIVPEILRDTLYDRPKEILNVLRQSILYTERAAATRGNSFALRYGQAMTNERCYINEITGGVLFLKKLRKTVAEAEKDGGAALAAGLAAVASKIFTRSRMTVSVTGNYTEAQILDYIGRFDAGAPAGPRCVRKLPEKKNTGIEIPAQIAFDGMVLCYPPEFKYSHSTAVAARYVSYDWLWNQVRVKGGAYGTHMSIGGFGQITFHSYRDPQPSASFDAFCAAAEKIRELAEGGDIEKYIISTLPSANPMLTPHSETIRDETLYFRGLPADDPVISTDQILATDAAELRRIADMLDGALKDPVRVVVGGRKLLEDCGDKLDVITGLS